MKPAWRHVLNALKDGSEKLMVELPNGRGILSDGQFASESTLFDMLCHGVIDRPDYKNGIGYTITEEGRSVLAGKKPEKMFNYVVEWR